MSSAQRPDPTGTKTNRKQFRRDARSRLRDARGGARRYVEQIDVDGPEPRVLRAFRNELRRLLGEHVVDRVPEREAERGRHWTGTYVRQAYDKGLRDAKTDLQRVDETPSVLREATSTSHERHRERRAREYLTAFYETEDVAERLHTHASRVVAEDVKTAESATALADDVTAELRDRGENSLAALANTVVVETVNEAKLTAFELSETVDTVAFDVEPPTRDNAVRENNETAVFTTAADDRVCPQCASLHGQEMPVDRLRENPGLLPPIHPNCRCYVRAP